MKNEYTVDWSLLKKWTNESHYSGTRLIFLIIWCVILLAALVFGVLSVIFKQYTNVIYFALIALISLYRAFFWRLMRAKREYGRLSEEYGKESWTRTIELVNEGLVITEEKTVMKYGFAEIERITEKDDTVYIRFKSKSVIRLYKSKFVDCTWEEFKAEIAKNNPQLI